MQITWKKVCINPISKQTLDTLKLGNLSDGQLTEARLHYSQLAILLGFHGSRYQLVTDDVSKVLGRIDDMITARLQK